MLAVGSIAPDFELPNQFGETVRLSDASAVGAVALVFFPLAFSSRCAGELGELRDNLSLFRDHGVTLFGVSVDSKFALRSWAEQEGYEFGLLSDFWPHGQVADSFGAFLPDRGFATRATFVIDSARGIRAAFHTDSGESRSMDAYAAALESIATD